MAVSKVTNKGMGAGAVLQVVSNTSTTAFNTTSSNTYLATSITPISSTSKILALLQVTASGTASTNVYMYIQLLRGGAGIWNADAGAQVAAAQTTTMCIEFLDSPATASPVTYSVLLGKGSAGTTSIDHARTSLVLMEIAA